MDDVNESLPELIKRRQTELGHSSLSALYRAASLGSDSITYETLRRIAKGEQRTSRDGGTTVSDLAQILRISEDAVRTAEAGYTPISGWSRYERLTESERAAVESIIDAILSAHDKGGQQDVRRTEAEKSSDEAGDGGTVVQLRPDPFTPVQSAARKKPPMPDELGWE